VGLNINGVKDAFIPRDIPFYTLFEEQIENIIKGAETFEKFIHTNDRDDREKFLEQIIVIEDRGDQKRFEISKLLAKTFITPIDREDILNITTSLDEILNYIYTATKEINIYNVNSTEGIKKMVEKIMSSIKELKEAIHLLKSKKYDEVFKHAIIAKTYENDVEDIYRKALKEMFESNDLNGNLGHYLKMREIYRHLSNTADKCDNSGTVLIDLCVKMM